MALCGYFVSVTITLILGWSDPSSLVWSMACPSMCTCRYKGGKETAECADERLVKIPVGLSRGTQVLDISKNNLRQLVKEEFFLLGLINLQKLYIAECKIRKIDDGAFSHLANLVELNLESNLLIAVPSETFEDYPELRKLILNNNPIRRIETLAFVRLSFLYELELSNCYVEYVGPRAFSGLDVLQDLRIDGNRLTTLPTDVGFPIRSLRNLQVFENPWICDCQLRVFRNWLVDDALPVSAPPVCLEPQRLQGRSLNTILEEEYACPPQTSPQQLFSAEVFNGNSAKLVCNVQSDPLPDIRWLHRGKLLTNSSRGQNSKVYSIHERGGVNRMSVLTIATVSFHDSGDYLCIADNLAGQTVVNISLEVIERSAESSSLSNGHIAGISIGLVMISVMTVVFICVLLTKMRRQTAQSEERKHLELVDKKQSLHLVNHTGNANKYEVMSKQRLQITPSGGADCNLLKRPLVTNCSSPGAGFEGDLTTVDTVSQLEDSIGGALIRSSSRMSSTKPDVVNFTCSTTSSPEDGRQQDNQLTSTTTTMKCSNSCSKISPVIENIKDSIRLMTSTAICPKSGGVGGSAPFLSSERSDSRERLCEYVQLYEEAEQQQQQSPSCGAESNGLECTLSDAVSSSRDVKSADSMTTNPVKSAMKNNNNSGVRIATGPIVHKQQQRYGPLGNACGGILKHVNLHGRNYVPVLPPLPVHHFAQVRDSPDEGYEDEVEEEMDT